MEAHIQKNQIYKSYTHASLVTFINDTSITSRQIKEFKNSHLNKFPPKEKRVLLPNEQYVGYIWKEYIINGELVRKRKRVIKKKI